MIEKILSRFREVGNIQFSRFSKPLIAVEDAIKIVQEVEKEYDWIPVETELPKDCKDVWVTVKIKDGDCYVTDSFYDLNLGKWRVGKLCEVTAWQPKHIPSAPYQKGE